MLPKPKVYLAGGFKSNWQERIVSQLGDLFIFFNPRDHGLEDATLYSAWDTHFVKECDILFAYMEKSNPSGYGLAFEIGLAAGLNKTIILVDERSATDQEFAKYFKLVQFPADALFSEIQHGIDFLIKFSSAKNL